MKEKLFFNHKIYAQKNEQGFGLIEIIMVILIISILVVIAIPSITGIMKLQRLNTYVAVIAGKAMDARMYAVKHNRTAWLRIDPTNRTTQLQTTNAAGNTISLKSAELLPSELRLTATTPVEFRFDSLGRLPGGNQTATFQTGSSGSSKTKSISVSPAGKITVGSMN